LIRVAIVTGNSIRTRSLADVLAEDDRLEIVEAQDFADVIITVGEGEEEIPRGEAPVVLMTDGPLDDRRFGREVRAWLPTNASAAEVVAAVVAVANDLVVMTQDQARRLLRVQEPAENDSYLVEPLTRRELQVMRMLADGLGNKEIAAQLGISDHTAKFHVAQILAKLGANSRAEAVALGIRRGLVPI
jgi:DNA-binding CsgD family transcriptional regulator